MSHAPFGVPTSQPSALATKSLQEARTKDDDWSGKGDATERRKRQNRLNQRAWRNRRLLPESSSSTDRVFVRPIQRISPSFELEHLEKGRMYIRQLVQDHLSGRRRITVAFELPHSRSQFWEALEKSLSESQSVFAYWSELRVQRKRDVDLALRSQHETLSSNHHISSPGVFSNAEENLLQFNRSSSPYIHTITTYEHGRNENWFPLPVDQQLFVLVQYNTLRGAMANMSILLHLNGERLDNWADIYTEDLPPPPDNAPPSLRPTHLQKTIAHESWIDILPSPTMRDNIIGNQANIDEDALCDDLVGGMHDGLSEIPDRGCILWGDPWSEEGWEFSEGFVKKWRFLLNGCDALIRATNRWRQIRGEDVLMLED